MGRIDIDTESQTWVAVRDWARLKIDTCRKRNDAPSLSPEETATLRGTIAAYKDLLALEVNPPPAALTVNETGFLGGAEKNKSPRPGELRDHGD